MEVADLLERRPHPVLRAADILVTHESQEDVAALRVAVFVDGHVSALHGEGRWFSDRDTRVKLLK